MDDRTVPRSVRVLLLPEVSLGDISHALLPLGTGHYVQGAGASSAEIGAPQERASRSAGLGTRPRAVTAVAATTEATASDTAPVPSRQALSYVLVTPARNEAALIEETIQSVIAQSVLPRKWIIVSDGSTDGTDEIVQRYARERDWIELLRLPERPDRHFAGKAGAFNAGYAHLSTLNSQLPGAPERSEGGSTSWDLIGNLDADITFGPDYLEFLLQKFSANPRLGVAGTPFVEDQDRLDQHSYAHQFANSSHVSGACQMFRRECFDEVGGYLSIKAGAIDWIAVTTARMKGWETRTFTEKLCFHHRELGVGSGAPGKLRMRFHYGRKAYLVGGHPLWEFLRGLFRMREKPFLLGSLWFIAGYAWAALRRSERAVSRELMQFHRAEQIARLRRAFRRACGN
ncbi:MAG: glycosyl transferase [Verrucomicrobia bacterium]|nr:MAG: glycosyl transferase [Verrucomicrobiota bacterium]